MAQTKVSNWSNANQETFEGLVVSQRGREAFVVKGLSRPLQANQRHELGDGRHVTIELLQAAKEQAAARPDSPTPWFWRVVVEERAE